MEVMGTGFDLPLTNEATIKACLDIYERRFVSKESQPEPIAHNIVAYHDVVGQLSRILTPRILPDLEVGRRPALLCKQATDILRSIGRELTDDASRCGFVCVLMGILEDLCDSNVEDLVPQKTKVIEEALRYLYQHWLVFPTTDAAVWTTLADHFPVWIPIVEVAKCWVVMTKTLQEPLMNVLLVTAGQDIGHAPTVDEETSPRRAHAPARPTRASGGSAARQRRAERPARPPRRADGAAAR